MKIILVNDTVYPFFKGGAPKRVYKIGRDLAHDNAVTWLGMKQWQGAGAIYQDGIKLDAVCGNLPMYKNNKRVVSQAIVYALRLFPKLLTTDFDAVYCTNFPCFPALVTKAVCWIKNKPMVLDIYEVWGKDYWKEYLGKLGIFGYFMEWLTVRTTPNTIADGVHVARLLKQELGITAKEIAPDGIDWQFIQDIKPSKEIYDLIYCGRLIGHKNLRLLLGAMLYLKQNGTDLSCCIIGSGEQYLELKWIVDKYNLCVTFKGYVDNDAEVIALMKSAKVFVHPSLQEGCGCTLPEATACGIPIVAVDNCHNSSRDYLTSYQAGFLSTNNREDYAHKIMAALDDGMPKTVIKDIKELDWQNTTRKFRRMICGKP